MTDQKKDPHTDTGILPVQEVFGKRWRWWRWFKEQWTKLSVSVVGGLVTVIIAVSGWALHVGTKVTVLEQIVVPDLALADKVHTLEAESAANKALDSAMYDQIKRVYDNLDIDLNEKEKQEIQRRIQDKRRGTTSDGKR